MKEFTFIISSILFAFTIFLLLNTTKLKNIISDSNFPEYLKCKSVYVLDGVGIIDYCLLVFFLWIERDYFNKFAFLLVLISNLILGFIIYRLILHILEKKLQSLDLYPAVQLLNLEQALSLLGINLYDDTENLSTLSLEYGKLTIFEYCSTKIYCESYSSGTVHTIYYVENSLTQRKHYLFKNCIPLSEISYWKELI